MADVERLTRSTMAVLIGLILTVLFAAVVLVVLFMTVIRADGQSANLLTTVLTLVTTSLGTVTGFVFGRQSPRR